ncbi:MAG: NADH-quinone oxidoreductase subunit L [Desulfobacteraceae bacterium]|nr:MAG: NADH-quinone oxidoreductase subunit L [Desulfobacteraceae bacterium]
MMEWVWLIPLSPLAGAIANGLAGKKIGKQAVGIIACSAVALSFFISVMVLFSLIALPAGQRSLTVTAFQWIASGTFQIDIDVLIDPLSTVMILVVTGVGLLIHIYSIGYMHGDQGYGRYFSFLNLFVFFMLMLVLSANYFVMFLGWEGVGLCSYLLIGFWYQKKTAADAGKKAFIVNRVGDFGFILGLLLLFWSLAGTGVQSLRFEEVFRHIPRLDPAILTAVTALLFAGAIGKSAQFPLHVWLPDAMEGPTPVSALIHAATMVTAGVYMVARNSALFALAPMTAEVVAGIGIFTAFFAATIGLVQNDIKRVLAFSTISQLGYMFAAVGLGAYSAGIFHLVTHAFFKGLLFLCAGSVIHALSGVQDMRHMGGLHRPMKITSITFIIGAMAIAGVPPFSGFWSKDEILWEAFLHGHYIIWAVGLLTAFLTAFYMFRQVFMVFSGRNRAAEGTQTHIHEAPGIMTTPLILLAALAIAGGWIGIPFFKGGSPLHNFLSPVFGHGEASAAFIQTSASAAAHGMMEFVLMGVSVAAGALGMMLSALMYFEPFKRYRSALLDPETLSARFQGLHRLLYNKYYVDEIYAAVIIYPLKRSSQYCLNFDLAVIDGLVNGAGWITRLVAWLAHKIDIYLVDGILNSLATLVRFNSGAWRRLQTGYLQNYALIFVLGLIVFVGVLWRDR